MNELAEISINYKPVKKYAEMPYVTSSNDCEKLFRSYWSDKMSHCEEFVIMLTNRANKVLGFSRISIGGTTGTICDPKVIFQVALKANATCLVLCHNHPSGNLKPSQADINLTRKLKSGAQLLDISILDHLILTEEGFFSFADAGII